VSVDGKATGEIGPGLVILVAVGKEDTAATASAMAEKVANLRIFADDAGKMNRSLLDTCGAAGDFVVYFVWRCARAEAAEFYSGGGAGIGEGAL